MTTSVPGRGAVTTGLTGLLRWGPEVAQLLQGEEIAVELNGRNHVSVRTTLRSALLHRGYTLRSKRTKTHLHVVAINLHPVEGVAKPKKDPTLGPGATNIAFVVSAADSTRLKVEAEQRRETISAAVRRMVHDYWDRKDRDPDIMPRG